MKNGFYKTRIKVKAGHSRIKTVLDYLATTIWDNTEYWGEYNSLECQCNISEWENEIKRPLSESSFDLVVHIENDNVIEFRYFDKCGNLTKVFD